MQNNKRKKKKAKQKLHCFSMLKDIQTSLQTPCMFILQKRMHALNRRNGIKNVRHQIQVTKGVQGTQNRKRGEGLKIQTQKGIDDYQQMTREVEEERGRRTESYYI